MGPIRMVKNGIVGNFTMSKVFLDTNILVYSMDNFDREKQQRSRDRLREISGRAVISTQVLQEFFVTVTRKLNIEALVAKDIMRTFYHCEVVMISPELIEEAVDCSILNRLSLWDSLIIVAAESANCSTLWSEDLNAGQVIRGVRIENPLIK